MSQLPINDPALWRLVHERISHYSLDGIEESDIRAILQTLAHQGQRPARRSDGLGVAFSALSFFEGIYERILTLALYDLTGAQNSRPAGGSDASDNSDSRGGSR